ncbi:DUF4265 domain-containing protein [Microbacterium sp.]|uniref:DUF4265 domain-containing protein n=1 Tax=Microbacterium sp. TaxID=51671 RepID=UPI003A8994AB
MSAASEQFSTHSEPIWRERADFIINAQLSEVGGFEQLWVRRVGEDQFEVCCIPYFLYNVALGDTIETAPQGGRQYVLSRVLNPSGRFVFRAYFERPHYRYRDATAVGVQRLGAQIEWSSPSLLAVDVDGPSAQRVADYLQDQEDAGRLVYETGKSA